MKTLHSPNYEELLQGDCTATSSRWLSKVEGTATIRPISSDWSSLTRSLSDKRLRQDSEVALVTFLSTNILDKAYLKSLPVTVSGGVHQLKIVADLLAALSSKLSEQSSPSTSSSLRLLYGVLICYVARKCILDNKPLSNSHQAFTIFSSTSIDLISLLETSLFSAEQSTSSVDLFISQLRKTLRRHPAAFTSQAERIQDILFMYFAQTTGEVPKTTSLTHAEAINITGILPFFNSANSASYYINLFSDNILQAFLSTSAKAAAIKRQQQKVSSSDLLQPAEGQRFIFNFNATATNKQKSLSLLSSIHPLTVQRVALLNKLIESIIVSVPTHSEQCWDMSNILSTVETIITGDSDQLRARNEDSTSYISLSFKLKQIALKLLATIISATTTSFTKYLPWLETLTTFASTTLLRLTPNAYFIKNILKVVIAAQRACSQTSASLTSSVFDSAFKPLDLLLVYFGSQLRIFKLTSSTETSAAIDEMNFRKEKKNKRHGQNQLSLQHDPRGSERIIIANTEVKIPRLAENNEQLTQLLKIVDHQSLSRIAHYVLVLIEVASPVASEEDHRAIEAVLSKILSYPRVVAFSPVENKGALFAAIESVILSSILSGKPSALYGEFDNFLQHYMMAEHCKALVTEIQHVRAKVFQLSQAWRINHVDNSIELQIYYEKRYSALEDLFAVDQVLSQVQTAADLTTTITQIKLEGSSIIIEKKNLDVSETWDSACEEVVSKKDVEINKKRAFTETAGAVSSEGDGIANSLPVKKLFFEQPAPSVEGRTTTSFLFGMQNTAKNSLFSSESATITEQSAIEVDQEKIAAEEKEEEAVAPAADLDDSDDELILNPVLDSD